MKRPASVLIAGVLFWAEGVRTLLMHTVLIPWSWGALAGGGFLVGAGALWLFRPRDRVTYGVGGLALVLLAASPLVALALVVTTRDRLPASLAESFWETIAQLAVQGGLLTWLTGRYLFGEPARAYFRHYRR